MMQDMEGWLEWDNGDGTHDIFRAHPGTLSGLMLNELALATAWELAKMDEESARYWARMTGDGDEDDV